MDLVMTTDKTIDALEDRVRKLAGEKSSLELVISLMNRMSEAPGLTNTIENMLRAVADVIGGVDLMVYYCIDGEIHFVDIKGNRTRIATIDDPLVQSVFETHRSIEKEHPFRDTRMTTQEFANAYTWAVPLLVGQELIGVFKIESLHISMSEMARELPTFFTYAALVLKNEILGHSRLQKAHDTLAQEVAIRTRAEEELRELNRDLEDRVSARTEQLQHANQRAYQLAAIVQSSEDAIIGKDLNGIITSWNPGAEKIYGYAESDVLGRSINILLPPGHEAEGEQIIRRIVAGEHIEHYEAVRCTRSGDQLQMSLTISPIRDAQGKVIAASTIARDITEKKACRGCDPAVPAGKGDHAQGDPSSRQEQPADHLQPTQPAVREVHVRAVSRRLSMKASGACGPWRWCMSNCTGQRTSRASTLANSSRGSSANWWSPTAGPALNWSRISPP